MADNDCLFIAIDFGTTFTGVASVYSQNPTQVHVVTQWPNSRMTSVKVPTLLSYDMEQDTVNVDEAAPRTSNSVIDSLKTPTAAQARARKEVRWGAELSNPQEPRISCIKLFLDKNQILPRFVDTDTVLNQLSKARRTPIAATADFLSKVMQFVLDELNARYTEEFMKCTRVEYIMTVPAIWSDAAKDATKQSAQLANIKGNINMISEPEAAAIWMLEAVKLNGLQLKIGDVLIVCDAGGGTVDLISYKLDAIEPYKIKECTLGTGDVCGSAILNCRFEDFVRTRFGDTKFKQLKDERPQVWQDAMRRFDDYIKPQFGGSTTQMWSIPFPGLLDDSATGISGGYLKLRSDEVKGIFDPIIDQVIKLVQGQVDGVRAKGHNPSAIACVGGFGQNKYLYNRLRAHFQTELPPPYTPSNPKKRGAAVLDSENRTIKVLQPPNGVEAVLRGALLSILGQSIVTERRSRCHYGICTITTFDAAKHPLSSRAWDEYYEEHRAHGVMRWYVSRDDAISQERLISFPFEEIYSDGRIESSGLIKTLSLHACRTQQEPLMHEATIFLVCTLTAVLTGVPPSLFKKDTNSKGTSFTRLSYNVTMKIESANIQFGIEINGKSYGSVTALFEH